LLSLGLPGVEGFGGAVIALDTALVDEILRGMAGSNRTLN
jgi:hypothetical protein